MGILSECLQVGQVQGYVSDCMMSQIMKRFKSTQPPRSREFR